MDAQKITKEESTETNGKREIKRSASYPALTVLDALAFATKLNDKFTADVEVTREEIGHVLGFHPNTVAREVACCAQYGYLSRTVTGKYKLTELFSDILHPESEKDKKLKLITAFGTPKIYQELIAKFDNQVIPLELHNTLIKHHGITEAASKSAAETFIVSGQQVGVINESRALKYQVTLSTVSKTQYAEIVDADNDSYNKNQLPSKVESLDIIQENYVADSTKKVPIYLTKDKTAYLVYPNEITANDITIITHQLEGILLRIKLENEEKQKGTEVPS
jgi:hypothetical protein